MTFRKNPIIIVRRVNRYRQFSTRFPWQDTDLPVISRETHRYYRFLQISFPIIIIFLRGIYTDLPVVLRDIRRNYRSLPISFPIIIIIVRGIYTDLLVVSREVPRYYRTFFADFIFDYNYISQRNLHRITCRFMRNLLIL